MRRLEKRYYQYTGCPAVCDCGQVCGWSPEGRVPDPEIVRLGITAGPMGARLSGYQREASEWYNHVGVIGVAHLDPVVSRAENRADEAIEISLLQPPFNTQHNPKAGTAEQEAAQARILGRRVSWRTRAEMRVERARVAADRLIRYVVAGLVGAAISVLIVLAML